MAQHNIIIDKKKYSMPKMSIDQYMDYLDASEIINESMNTGYRREHIELMAEWVVKLYGNQFTVEDVKDMEKGLTADELVTEFMFVDMDLAEKIQNKMKKVQENFQKGK